MSDYEKVKEALRLVETYLLPLAEVGASKTTSPIDNLVVALLKGGLPEVIKELDRLASK